MLLITANAWAGLSLPINVNNTLVKVEDRTAQFNEVILEDQQLPDSSDDEMLGCCMTATTSIIDQDGVTWSASSTCCASDICAISAMCAQSRADAYLLSILYQYQ